MQPSNSVIVAGVSLSSGRSSQADVASRERWIWALWFLLLVWFKQTHETDQTKSTAIAPGFMTSSPVVGRSLRIW